MKYVERFWTSGNSDYDIQIIDSIDKILYDFYNMHLYYDNAWRIEQMLFYYEKSGLKYMSDFDHLIYNYYKEFE